MVLVTVDFEVRNLGLVPIPEREVTKMCLDFMSTLISDAAWIEDSSSNQVTSQCAMTNMNPYFYFHLLHLPGRWSRVPSSFNYFSTTAHAQTWRHNPSCALSLNLTLTLKRVLNLGLQILTLMRSIEKVENSVCGLRIRVRVSRFGVDLNWVEEW